MMKKQIPWRRHIPAILLIAALLASAPASRAEPQVKPPDLDASVARVMEVFEVPGVAVAVVEDGKVVIVKGYGVRRLGRPGPVDGRTLFGIASNTKAFTATALGILVDEGRIEWDSPVTRYLPWFQMYDPYVTRELAVRDLLVHRSGLGLGAGDLLLWPPSLYDRREIARRLRFIKPATSFRSAYAYDNVLYLVAGEVIQAVSGLTWEDFVAERIFKRVGMRESRARHSADISGRNIAAPHVLLEGSVRPEEPSENDNINPAGGICSSAADMAKWMLVHLDAGRLPDGTRLLSEATAHELVTPVTPMPISSPPAELATQRMNFLDYALGFRVHDYKGRKIVTHTGGLSGYVSKLTMVPELALGITVLTNQEAGEAYNAITYYLLDQFLGGPLTDWVDAYFKVRERRLARFEQAEKNTVSSRDGASRPSLPLDAYAGTFNDAWYGDIAIADEEGKLVMRFTKTPGLVGDLEHWQYDTFVVRWRDRTLRADAFVTFALSPEGAIEQARMKPISPATDFSYDFQDLLLKPVRR